MDFVTIRLRLGDKVIIDGGRLAVELLDLADSYLAKFRCFRIAQTWPLWVELGESVVFYGARFQLLSVKNDVANMKFDAPHGQTIVLLEGKQDGVIIKE